MSFKELIINAGSSSLKYQVFEMPEAKVLAKGIFEQIGTACDHEVYQVATFGGVKYASKANGKVFWQSGVCFLWHNVIVVFPHKDK